MIEIPASLPALGAFRIHLHRESAQVLDFFGSEELARLGRVDHLGVATAAFPGINHTRLEYVLLQCAIAQLVAKLYKDNKDLALSNRVELDGMARAISSGEELIKCWAILSNVGHPNWTFGTERSLMDAAIQDQSVRTWLLSGAIEPDLAEWARDVLNRYGDTEARFLITLLRLREHRPHDSRKYLFRQLVRNLVLDERLLVFPSPTSREKLNRLRILSARIRLLAMVTLDAYHSHSPVRLQLLPAIQELAESAYRTSGFEKFLSVLEATAGWLADEVYQHPKAVAIQREYETRGARLAQRRFQRLAGDDGRRRQFLRSFMADGFGQPKAGILEPLVRLSMEHLAARLLGGGNRHDQLLRLNDSIAVPAATLVSIDRNEFLRATHIDVLYRPRSSDASQIGETYSRLVRWLLTAVEAQSLDLVRRMYPPGERQSPRAERARVRTLGRRLGGAEYHLQALFMSILEHLVPVGWTVSTEDHSGGSLARPIGWRVIDSKNHRFDRLTERLDTYKAGLQSINHLSRAHEVETLTHVTKNRWKTLVVVALHPIIVRDHFGRKKDEWDGVFIEVDDTTVRVTVIEAKSSSSLAKRAEVAFGQLAQTRAILKSRYPLRTRRRRVDGMGALLVVDLWRRA